jgi:hypothetical protein
MPLQQKASRSREFLAIPCGQGQLRTFSPQFLGQRKPQTARTARDHNDFPLDMVRPDRASNDCQSTRCACERYARSYGISVQPSHMQLGCQE